MNQSLLSILACPKTKAPVVLDGERLVSTDPETRLAYRIEQGIPVMLVGEATVLSPEEHAAVLQQHGAKPWQSTGRKSSQ